MKTFPTIREIAKTGLLTEYSLRMLLKSDDPPPHVKINKKILINYPKFIEWLNEKSRGE